MAKRQLGLEGAVAGILLVACCMLARLPAGPVALSSSTLVYPGTRWSSRTSTRCLRDQH
jgi:hypothetical protein